MTKYNHLFGFKLFIGIISMVGILYILYPFVSIVTFFDSRIFASTVQDPQVQSAFLLSICTASISTALIILFGLPLSYALSRFSFPGKPVVYMIVIIPLIIPPLASGALLLGVFNPYSVLSKILPEIEFTQSILGVIIAQTYVASPFMILASVSAFDTVDKSLENMARVLGRKNWQVFFEISLPLAKNGILIGILMSWIRAIGELGATMMLAYNPHTISIQIYEDNALGGLTQAIPSILLSITLSVILILFYSVIMKKTNHNSDEKSLIKFERFWGR
jgi:molybdate/tungstate transport system permease protein